MTRVWHENERGIDPANLLQLFEYDAASGRLTRLRSNNQHPVGSRAGDRMPSGYRRVKIDGISIQEHRVIWALVYGVWPDGLIDHINGVRDDNRLINLRIATPSQNKTNETIRRDNNLGVKGVRLHESGKYHARIYYDHHHHSLGLFNTMEEAAMAYKIAAEKHFGEFSRVI